MKCLAVITNEERNKGENKKLWKWIYTFVNVDTEKEDYFYSRKKTNYTSRIIGKLKLSETDDFKFYQSFIQDEFKPYKSPIQLEKDIEKNVQKLGNYFVGKTIDFKSPQLIGILDTLHREDKTWDKTATRFKRTSRMLRYWRKDLISQTPKVPKKEGRKSIMCEDCFLLLLFLTNSPKYNTKTQQQKSDHIFEKTGHRYSQQVISYNLKKYSDFTCKRAAKRYSEQDLEKVRQFLNEYHWLYSLPNCLAVDEFSVRPGESARYAWSRRGCPAVVKQKGRSASYTLILCVLNTKEKAIVSWKLFKNEKKKIKDEKTGKVRTKKGTDTIDFYNFLKNIELPTNEKYYLLLDNSPIHDPPNKRPSKILREEGLLSMEELAKEKNITLVYLPGYTPELNPIELCFNTVRHFTENWPTDDSEQLKKSVDEIIDMINKKPLTKYFRHCQDFFYFDKSGN